MMKRSKGGSGRGNGGGSKRAARGSGIRKRQWPTTTAGTVAAAAALDIIGSPEPEVYVPNYSPLEQQLLLDRQQRQQQQIARTCSSSTEKVVNRLNSVGDQVTYMDLSGDATTTAADEIGEPTEEFMQELDALLTAESDGRNFSVQANVTALECIYGNMSNCLSPQSTMVQTSECTTAAAFSSNYVDQAFQMVPREQQSATEEFIEKTWEISATNFSTNVEIGTCACFLCSGAVSLYDFFSFFLCR
jgi:hypothetical protein